MVKNITFDGFNQSPAEQQNKLKWIQVYGYDNEIANCSFLNKKGVGNCITIERNDVIENRTLIHHNFFAYREAIVINGSVLNDQDAMRLGWSGSSLSDASCQVYNNFFYDWNREVEIISNKSCRNKYYNNTFQKCVGTLTLRHGTHCEVYNNFFFGENISKSGLDDVGVLIGALPEENTTGSQDSNNSGFGINIYPNPAKNFIALASDLEIQQTRIIDLQGSSITLKSENILQKQITFDVSEINKGIYILEITLRNKAKVSNRIVIN